MRIFPSLPKPLIEYKLGAAYLGDALEIMKCIPNSSINLILTSPPFALTRKKEYGNEDAEQYVEWFVPFAREFYRTLKDDGSLIIDLGGAYLPGAPVRSIYQFELLVHLCREMHFYLAQDFYHYNPSRLPAPAEWVNVRRIRVKDSVNVVWWLSKSKYPKADNRRVLKEYSSSMKALLRNGYTAKLRPSGHDISKNFSKNNGGAIPPNLFGYGHAGEEAMENILEIANTESNSSYIRGCRKAGIKPHPARFPSAFAAFFINFLTEANEIVVDPFSGSNTTGFVAETLKRRWISMEINEDYLRGSHLRFTTSKNDARKKGPSEKTISLGLTS
jgi:site-specific DNA-methyltransferase (cytosine-N4-specific)